MICQHKSFFVNTNIYSRKGNRNFPQRTPIWQRFAFWEEGEFAPLYIMCALIKGAKSGETADSRFCGVRRCRPQIAVNRRQQLAEIYASFYKEFL